MRSSACLGLALLAGCNGGDPASVTMSGIVWQAWDDPEGIDGAELVLLDQKGDSVAETATDPDGSFEIEAPTGEEVYLAITTDGPTATFNGVTGVSASLQIEEGALYAFSAAERATWEADFSACPGADGAGGVVFGQMRVINLSDPETGENPVVFVGFARVEDDAGDRIDACYLNDDGTAVDPEATRTGTTGRFAIFGVPAGRWEVVLGYDVAEGTQVTRHPIWVLSEGVVPLLPAWVEFYLGG